MTQVDVDLTQIAGIRNARVVLTVLATGPSGGDRALWVGPRLVRSVASPVIITPTVGPTAIVPTTTPVPGCDRAQFVTDVTVPDGTTFAPNAPFSKTWRLKNTGYCTWTTAYSLVFVSGDRMGGVTTLIPQSAVPGQTVDVGINFNAPSLAGSYRGYWQLKNASGDLFGIGTNADQPFYVDIKVSGTPASTPTPTTAPATGTPTFIPTSTPTRTTVPPRGRQPSHRPPRRLAPLCPPRGHQPSRRPPWRCLPQQHRLQPLRVRLLAIGVCIRMSSTASTLSSRPGLWLTTSRIVVGACTCPL